MDRDAVILFSGGAGAWELGCEWAGVNVALSVEIDSDRRAMLRANFPETPQHDDVQTLTADLAKSLAGRGIGWRPWLIAGSPPCQDASYANPARRGIEGQRTGLFRPAVRLVRALRPDWVAFENVDGLSIRESGAILEWLGPDYRGWIHLLADECVGAPHRGRRRWIVARRLSEADEEPIQSEGRRRAAGAEAAEHRRAPAVLYPQAYAHRQSTLAVNAGPMAGGAGARRPGRGHWSDDAIETASRHLRMADGLPGRLAKQTQESFGDSFPPILAQCWIEAMIAVETNTR